MDAINQALAVLDTWSGGETLPFIPIRVRGPLAEIFAALLMKLVAGDDRASGLLNIFPKLVLSQAGMKPGAAGITADMVERRAIMFGRGQIAELVTEITGCRAAKSAGAAKRDRDDTKRRLGGVRSLARAGALSKAVKRLTGEMVSYDPQTADRWARTLIPNPPDSTSSLGATPITAAERAELAAIRTVASPSRDGGAEVASGESADAPAADGDMSAGSAAAASDPQQERAAPTAATRPVFHHGEGVRFGALSAPGPSGLRPEHLHAFSTTRRAGARHRYDEAMRAFVGAAIRGELPECAWWITGSSLTFIKKKGAGDSDAPRPLRVGEVLRRCVAKRIAAAERATMRKLFVQRRQFGVACPGGAEVLIHHRIQTRAAVAGAGDHMVTWDADISNCFGSLLWPAVDDSVKRHIPGALPWTRWCHRAPVRVILPGGHSYHTQRGAEQGDPLGSAYAAAVIADVCDMAHGLAHTMRTSLVGTRPTAAAVLDTIATQRATYFGTLPSDARTSADLLLQPPPPADSLAWDASAAATTVVVERAPQVADVWYIDDSYIRGDALDGDLWLAAWDMVGAATGVRRSTTKSLVRRGRADMALPPYSAATCADTPHSAPVKCLGVRLGQEAQQLAQEVEKARLLHEAIATLDDPALVLVLTRASADVCRIVHLLRAVGPVAEKPLADFDDLMREAVGRVVRTEVTDLAAEQATWGVRAGGLGLRKATATAGPAHVASLVESEQLVSWLTRECAKLGVGGVTPAASITARAATAIDALLSSIDHEPTRVAVKEGIADARADIGPSAVPAILRDRPPSSGRPPPRPPPSPGDIVADASGDAKQSKAAPHGLQHKILAHLDTLRLTQQIAPLRAVARSSMPLMDAERLLRLQDLADRSTSHDWLWAINPAHGPVLPPDAYITSVRLRLGLPVASYAGERPCAECGESVSAVHLGPHALLCAKGRRVIRHNLLRDHLHSLARASDPASRLEAALVDSPDAELRRPADLLLSASPFGSGASGAMAVDVGIVAPHNHLAVRCDSDPLDAYLKRKVDKSLADCRNVGWAFYPFIVSAHGRPHPGASRMVSRLCAKAAREFVVEQPKRLESNWWRNATSLLMIGAASMVERCRPVLEIAPGIDGCREDMRGVEPHRPLRRTSLANTLAPPLIAGATAPPVPPE
jgi:hypothetical protein